MKMLLSLFLVNRYLTSSFMVRSRSLPIAFTGEKEKPKQNDKKKKKQKNFPFGPLCVGYNLTCALCAFLFRRSRIRRQTFCNFVRTPFYFFFFVCKFFLLVLCVSLFLSVGCFPFFWGFCISPCRFGWRVATSSFWRRRGERIGTSESLSATTSCLLASFCGCLALELSHQPRVLIYT